MLFFCLLVALASSSAQAQQDPRTASRPESNQQVEAEHPLLPALRIAQEAIDHIDNDIQDYSCTLVKRERIDGKLQGPDYIFMKIRHRPFSVYTYYLKPDNMRGQEAIYVEGQNDGKLQAHGTGVTSVIGTISLDPDGAMAMKGQLYPITKAGIRNMLTQLLDLGARESKFGECEVKFFKGAKVDGRECTMIEVHHPQPRRNFKFALARIFLDEEYKVPIRFEGYTWPKRPGQPLQLAEEYTYTRLKLNRGYSDLDFDTRNKNYGFE